jgi:hypothetical protein
MFSSKSSKQEPQMSKDVSMKLVQESLDRLVIFDLNPAIEPTETRGLANKRLDVKKSPMALLFIVMEKSFLLTLFSQS